ncbi:hypothetical protein [Bacillus sp. 1NLA3E]|uniref:hypothetical protein n=1 Tax=Bacillus sp. 1NLA3E TaxID=666686 RepID=UPI000247EEA7|nr:hypothetical protein [Bacillus sp. 1NLA3E]
MKTVDFKVANLKSSQMEKLKQFENELGCTLIAYEHKGLSESKSYNTSETP